MNEKLFLFWNGWGLLCVGIYFASLLFSIVASILFSWGPVARFLSGLFLLGAIISLFISSGFIGGLLSLTAGYFVLIPIVRWLSLGVFGTCEPDQIRRTLVRWLDRILLSSDEYKIHHPRHKK